jgi:ABC-type hemin transport system substrate-binding protein
MHIKRKNLLALSFASLGILGAFTSVSAASIQSMMRNGDGDKIHTAIKTAIAKNDYQAFLLATKDKPAGSPNITEVQFNTLVQADKLRAAGDQVGAKALIKAAGIIPEGRHSKGDGSKEMETFMSTLTDAQKAVMTQAHTLMASGKKDEADLLLKNAGITLPSRADHDGKGRGHKGMSTFISSLTDAQKITWKQSRELVKAGKKDEADLLLKNAGITLPTRSVHTMFSTSTKATS